jgi:glycosyltransferase involved in cell wall biosynthesis
VVSTLTEGLVAAGHHVTLYATGDSVTAADLVSVVARGYEPDRSYDADLFIGLHIAQCFEDVAAGGYDLVHSHLDYRPLAFSRLVDVPVVTTIHGFSSPAILPAFRRYDDRVHYVAISDADRHPDLTYTATVHHGIELDRFPFSEAADPDQHVLFFGRIHPDKGTAEAIDIARAAGRSIRLAGIIHDEQYFRTEVEPRLGDDAVYLGPVGGMRRAEVLGAASALLHPVAFEEPFGLSVVESMLCGTPVIAYPRGSMPEIVTEGSTGFLVDGLAAAAAALGRVETVDRATCRAIAARRFSAARMVAAYETVYRSVLRGAAPDSACAAPCPETDAVGTIGSSRLEQSGRTPVVE